ncbi:MAG: amidohydrolase family protein [Pseudomonadota bacterium]|nr:amidohydrolase family protein [Pseudomonadota bacterium]
MDPRRNYTPHESSLDAYRKVMGAIGIGRGVIVQPSVYGTDNRATLDALQAGGPAFRAIVVPAADVSDDQLERMHALGVRGLRLNLLNPQMLTLDAALAILARVAGRGWHLQVLLDLGKEPDALRSLVDKTSAPVVVDHMGKLAPNTRKHPLFDLLKAGACWVKLSGAYRVSAEPPPHADLTGLARAFADANPAQVIWGSDWPHTELHQGTPSAASLAALVQAWLPDEALRHQICVSNASRLYGFIEEEIAP